MTSLFQNPHEIVTEIVMSRDGIPWLTVEGDTDERFFRSRKFQRDVKIVVAAGWEGVRDVLISANACQHSTIVVGVIDRDYRDHTNSQPIIRGLVFTDLRDIEGMMFWSSALHRVYCELGSFAKLPKYHHEKVDYSQIRTQITSACEKIGRFRAHCFVSGQSVSFKDLDYAKFVCDRSLNLDVSKFLAHIRGRDNGTHIIDETGWNIAQTAEHLHKEYSDPKWLCHGHDLMAFVAISLRRIWGSRGGGISREDIESVFRVGFGDEELATTSMWNDICGNLAAKPTLA
jgi:hypothetical protein